MVLGTAELGRNRQLDLLRVGLGEVIARDLVAGVGQGFLELVAEGIGELGEAGFLRTSRRAAASASSPGSTRPFGKSQFL